MENKSNNKKPVEEVKNIDRLLKQMHGPYPKPNCLIPFWDSIFQEIISLNHEMINKSDYEKKATIKDLFKLDNSDDSKKKIDEKLDNSDDSKKKIDEKLDDSDDSKKKIDELFDLIFFNDKNIKCDDLANLKDIDWKKTDLDNLKEKQPQTYKTIQECTKLIIKNIFKACVNCYTEKYPEKKIKGMELCILDFDQVISKIYFFKKITGQKYVINPKKEDDRKAEREYQSFKDECYQFVYGKPEKELPEEWSEESNDDLDLIEIPNIISPAEQKKLIDNLKKELNNGVNTQNSKQVIKQIKNHFNEFTIANQITGIDLLISKSILPKDVLNIHFKRFYDLLLMSDCIPNNFRDITDFKFPYETAFKYFEVYVGSQNHEQKNLIDIHKLFTDDDLAFLGGEEFIKDCYKKVYYLTNTDQIPPQYLSCKEKLACDIYFTSNILWANAKAFLATGSVALIFLLLVLFEVVALASTLAIIIAMSAILLGTIIATIVGCLHTKKHIKNQQFNSKLQDGKKSYSQYKHKCQQPNEEIYKKPFDKQNHKPKEQLLGLIDEEDDRSDEKE